MQTDPPAGKVPAGAAPPPRPEPTGRLTLGRLRALAAAAALALIVALELVREALYPYVLSWPGKVLMGGAAFAAACVLLSFMFGLVERMQDRLERQNQELLALHSAALDIYSELSLESVLQRVVDRARLLIGARYGALSVIDDQGRIQSFETSGLNAEERARLGRPPEGHGLLGVALREGQRLRLAEIGRDPRSVGFPPHHPKMHSLLAVPVVCRSPFRGNLYLSDRLDGQTFTADDEETLVRFATKAAIAIDHAHLHQQLSSLAVAQERLRIANEMHDGLAQVLAYVNTKAQAVREFLRSGRSEEAARQLDQLAAAAREVYTDVRESIVGLRTAAGPELPLSEAPLSEALHEIVASWQGQSEIPCQLEVDDDLRLEPVAQLQVMRIVQEALANVRKHARAQRAEVTLERNGGHARLTVSDDGIGFNSAELGRSDFPRFGLGIMRERAGTIGGVLRLDSSPAGGTRVVVEVPLQ